MSNQSQFYYPSGGEFMPPTLLEWLEKGTRPRAKLKSVHEDFVVEEQGLCGTRFTINTTSDLSADQVANPPQPTGFIRVTMVKRGLMTSHAESLLRARLREAGYDVKISYAGNKDRTGCTAQGMVIQGTNGNTVPLEAVLKLCRPHELNGRDWFIKDPIYVQAPLSIGGLAANWFRVRLVVPGMNATQISSYLQEKVQLLAEKGYRYPHVYGNQRRGRCQNNDLLGYAFLTLGPQAAFKLCLTMGASDESPFAKAIRAALAESWAGFEEAQARGATLDEQYSYFVDMHHILTNGLDRMRWHEHPREPVHVRVNMPIEYAIVNTAAKTRCLYEVAMTHRRDCSMWVGAIQAYWYNQALARVLRGEIVLPEGMTSIPLLVNKEKALRFYGQYFPEALPGDYNRKKQHLFRLDNRVSRKYFQPYNDGPERQLFAEVSHLQYKVSNEEVVFENMLPPGTYETTLLSMFFDINSDYNNGEGGAFIAVETED